MFPDNRHAWKFDFPDGQHFETDGTRHADIPNVGRKIKELCGEVHQKQIGSVAFLLSQAGTSALRNKPLAKYGIKTDEHCPVNFSLSRDAATGAVTIRYTSPEDLPCKFEWTATVDVDGKVTSTPMKVGAFTEKKVVAEAARKLGVNLSDAQSGEVTRLFLAHGTNMPARSAGLFAGFLVKVVAEKSVRANRLDAVAADTAASIREWRGFSFDDPDLSAFNEAAKSGPFTRVAYALELERADGAIEWAVAAMDAFTDDAAKLGVPCASGATFQRKVSNLVVRSNRIGVEEGAVGDGIIEFFRGNYGMPKKLADANGSDKVYDCNDTEMKGSDGYGCMQVHNAKSGATIFAYNHFAVGGAPDLGIGSNKGNDHTDWTFMYNAGDYKTRRLTVLVK